MGVLSEAKRMCAHARARALSLARHARESATRNESVPHSVRPCAPVALLCIRYEGGGEVEPWDKSFYMGITKATAHDIDSRVVSACVAAPRPPAAVTVPA